MPNRFINILKQFSHQIIFITFDIANMRKYGFLVRFVLRERQRQRQTDRQNNKFVHLIINYQSSSSPRKISFIVGFSCNLLTNYLKLVLSIAWHICTWYTNKRNKYRWIQVFLALGKKKTLILILTEFLYIVLFY